MGRLSNLLADLVAANDPNGKRPTVTEAWLNAERLMLERDDRDWDVAERLIRWCQQDEFWKANVQSMPKFRQQYGRLFLRASRASAAPKAGGTGEHAADRRVREARERRAEDAEVIDAEAEEEESP